MPRREFASYKDLQDYAKRTGKVSLLQGVKKRQQMLSPVQYELVDVNTARGVPTAMLIPKAVLKALGAADATFRDVAKPKHAAKQRSK